MFAKTLFYLLFNKTGFMTFLHYLLAEKLVDSLAVTLILPDTLIRKKLEKIRGLKAAFFKHYSDDSS